MPWLNSLAVQVTAFTVKQPARFGLGDGGGWPPQCHSTWARQLAGEGGCCYLEHSWTDILSPGAGRSGERGQPPAKDNLDATANSGCCWNKHSLTRQREVTALPWAAAGSRERQAGFNPWYSFAQVLWWVEKQRNQWWTIPKTLAVITDNSQCTHFLEKMRGSKPLRLMLVTLLRVFAIGKHCLQGQEHGRRIFRK